MLNLITNNSSTIELIHTQLMNKKILSLQIIMTSKRDLKMDPKIYSKEKKYFNYSYNLKRKNYL